MAFEESTGVLRKAEGEYKGHHSLLSRTRNLLSTMQRQDVLDRVILVVGFLSISKFQKAEFYLDRVILVVGFLLFSCAVLYIVSKRMGILKLQRTVTAAIKAGMAGKRDIGLRTAGDVINLAQGHGNAVPRMDMPLEQPCMLNFEVSDDLLHSVCKLQWQGTKFPFDSIETAKLFPFSKGLN